MYQTARAQCPGASNVKSECESKGVLSDGDLLLSTATPYVLLRTQQIVNGSVGAGCGHPTWFAWLHWTIGQHVSVESMCVRSVVDCGVAPGCSRTKTF